MNKGIILLILTTIMALSSCYQGGTRIYSFNGNLLNNDSIFGIKGSKIIVTQSNECFIIVPIVLYDEDTTFLCSWAYLEESGDTFIFNSLPMNRANDLGYFTNRHDSSINFYKVLSKTFPELDSFSYNYTYYEYQIENLRFFIQEDQVVEIKQ